MLCGNVIFCGPSKIVDFVGHPYPQIYIRINEWSNIDMQQTSYKITYQRPTNQQNFHNPQTLAPTNKNDSRVTYFV